jgi:hypothetical protein
VPWLFFDILKQKMAIAQVIRAQAAIILIAT